jgi:Rod binding domain-containing protein
MADSAAILGASAAAGTPAASRLMAATPIGSDKARQVAEDFEAVFANVMFQQMFTDVDGDGPFGGSAGTAMWRSFLTDEYAKSFAKAGGFGIADQVYRTLIAQQETRR